MCGIFGHTQPGKNPTASRRALNTLAHRGPDQWNDWQDKEVYVGHRRLSIIDLSEHGRQPMSAQGVVITVNGEIYNYKTLKKELGNKYAYQSDSDSEVLIYGYLEWGMDKLLEKLEGMYAFVLYDTRQRKLFLGRDRAGIKPLYYSHKGGQIAWASELKALTSFHTEAKLEVDSTAVYDYLTYRYIPTPKTLYKDVYKLPPAQYLELDLHTHKLQKKQYWTLGLVKINPTLDEAAAKVRELVDQAVQEQLMSDVPVGFFLSGGMDSSTVVGIAAQHSKQLNTYAIGFDIKEHDETHFAELVAKKFKTNHRRKVVSVGEVKKLFPKIKDWYDEPFADTSTFPVYIVSKLTKPSSTVVLTGDGGDEVFGGYNWYADFKKNAPGFIKENYPGSRLKRKLTRSHQATITNLEFAYYTKLMGGLTREEKAGYRKQFGIADSYDDYWYFRKFYRPELPLYTRLQYLDFHTYLHDDILTKVDRASMAVALECRVPLLSTPLIEYLFSLPENIRYHNGELKGLMKYAFHDLLPDEILNRKKKGFSIPTGRWQPNLMERDTTVPEFILKKFFNNTTGRSKTAAPSQHKRLQHSRRNF
ncbi:MAG TPA: asparagine synthase (glutamine-hydrolyzing) [Candidatus Limnocylindria bacterium]|nr:asparagine synthase (glutamine-hydrolyzing) [Candidatus Limnocylindria bacterium]